DPRSHQISTPNRIHHPINLSSRSKSNHAANGPAPSRWNAHPTSVRIPSALLFSKQRPNAQASSSSTSQPKSSRSVFPNQSRQTSSGATKS
ncbi:hypothetical protein ACLOJK_037107, partial [Asimina triloba]